MPKQEITDHAGATVWTMDAIQADAVAWFREHMVWAFREAAVAKGARIQMEQAGMPANAIEWACHQVVAELIECDWRE